jgi:hypothetical protein
MSAGRRQHHVTVVGSHRGGTERLLGTNRVPVNLPVPNAVMMEDGDKTGVYSIDYEALSEEQKRSLAKHIENAEGVPHAEAVRLLREEAAFVVPAEDCLLEEFTHEQIGLVRDLCRELRPRGDWIEEMFIVAREIAYGFLGHKWVEENIGTQFHYSERRMEFLRLRAENDLDAYRRQDRLIELSDILFTLQYCNGFKGKITYLRALDRTKEQVHFEDLFIELEVANIFKKSGNAVEFVKPSGVKEQDYDLKVTTADDVSYAVEVKCKREGIPGNVKSLRLKLRQAAKQLPEKSQGLAVVRVPEDWTRDDRLGADIVRVLNRYINGGTRLTGVILIWEEWLKGPGSQATRLLKYRPFVRDNLEREVANSINSLFLCRGISLSFGTFF